MGPPLVTRQVSKLLVVHFIGRLFLKTKPHRKVGQLYRSSDVGFRVTQCSVYLGGWLHIVLALCRRHLCSFHAVEGWLLYCRLILFLLVPNPLIFFFRFCCKLCTTVFFAYYHFCLIICFPAVCTLSLHSVFLTHSCRNFAQIEHWYLLQYSYAGRF